MQVIIHSRTIKGFDHIHTRPKQSNYHVWASQTPYMILIEVWLLTSNWILL